MPAHLYEHGNKLRDHFISAIKAGVHYILAFFNI